MHHQRRQGFQLNNQIAFYKEFDIFFCPIEPITDKYGVKAD